jgi:two-component system, chemotaxis family, protein-glutamate methylesterase/glutaminase
MSKTSLDGDLQTPERRPTGSDNPRARPHSEVIGICASTGGPRALSEVLRRLPNDYGIPILVVQHMIPGFLDGLVAGLNKELALSVGLAGDGQRLAPGVWFAPDGAHLKLELTCRLALDSETVQGNHRPAGDVLLGSLARVAGARAVAVVLTGMGRDGAEGLAAVAAAGGRTIAQDEQSSAVYGMPRVAAERGAKRVLAPSAIGDELAALEQIGARP